MTFSSADDVLRFISEEQVEFIDVRFVDLPGTVQHFTIPVETFDADVFTEGRMFDGSSIRGFQQIHESDMLLLPDPLTFRHRAGVRPYTSPYGFARSCVFSKQSLPTGICGPRQRPAARAVTSKGSPFPKVTGIICLVP